MISACQRTDRTSFIKFLPAMSDSPTNKILLVLDLDETLIHATEKPLEREPDFRLEQFFVYCRPYLAEFIQNCSEVYSLAVWSTASDNYVRAVAEEIFPNSSSLEFIWGQSRCTMRRIIGNDTERDLYASGEPRFQKHLKKLSRLGWPLEKILIVDDSPEKVSQNYGNAIYPEPYYGDLEDRELLLLEHYLQQLKECENVRRIEKRNWRSTAEKISDRWQPLPGEKPEEYVERVEKLDDADLYIVERLQTHFGMFQGEAKMLSLESRAFWERFFREYVERIFHRGGSRYAALRYIQRKNGQTDSGKPIFAQGEIDELIDSIGDWKH